MLLLKKCTLMAIIGLLLSFYNWKYNWDESLQIFSENINSALCTFIYFSVMPKSIGKWNLLCWKNWVMSRDGWRGMISERKKSTPDITWIIKFNFLKISWRSELCYTCFKKNICVNDINGKTDAARWTTLIILNYPKRSPVRIPTQKSACQLPFLSLSV